MDFIEKVGNVISEKGREAVDQNSGGNHEPEESDRHMSGGDQKELP